jgi:Flp pilus assembly protein TadG
MAGRGLAAVRRRLPGFRGDSGATALEFATLAPLFFVWVFVILQMCLLIFLGQSLQTATVRAGRAYMTGQSAGTSQAKLLAVLQDNLPPFFNANNVVVDVRTATTAAGLASQETSLSYTNNVCTAPTAPTPCTPSAGVCSGSGSSETCTPSGAFSTSTPTQYVLMRAFYPAPLIGSGFGFGSTIVGTTVFQVEPYQSS